MTKTALSFYSFSSGETMPSTWCSWYSVRIFLRAVVDAAQTAAAFADAHLHRLLVEREVFAEAVERELLFQRLHEQAPSARALGALEAVAFQVDAEAKPLALLADVDLHSFRIEFHRSKPLSRIRYSVIIPDGRAKIQNKKRRAPVYVCGSPAHNASD